MDTSAGTGQRAALSDYLAAERTLLAWIRTGLALMGFGFVVARFGLYLQQLQVAQHSLSPQSYGLSPWFGTVLIAAGVIVNVFAGWHHLRLVRELDRGETAHSRPSIQPIAIAFFLALVGLAMTIYLLTVHSYANLHSQSNEEVSMTPAVATEGIIDKLSNHSVEETVERLKNILQSKGVTLFALIDHSGQAEKVGMKMPPTKLLIFGSPKAGTPLMLAAPRIAIDLPLKILVWEDPQAKVWVSYNSPVWLQKRHSLPPDMVQNIAVVETLAAKAAEAGAGTEALRFHRRLPWHVANSWYKDGTIKTCSLGFSLVPYRALQSDRLPGNYNVIQPVSALPRRSLRWRNCVRLRRVLDQST